MNGPVQMTLIYGLYLPQGLGGREGLGVWG